MDFKWSKWKHGMLNVYVTEQQSCLSQDMSADEMNLTRGMCAQSKLHSVMFLVILDLIIGSFWLRITDVSMLLVFCFAFKVGCWRTSPHTWV